MQDRRTGWKDAAKEANLILNDILMEENDAIESAVIESIIGVLMLGCRFAMR